MMTSLSIIIVTWNCREYADECLESLKDYRRDVSTEIIVVDNSSKDGTPELVRGKYPEVKLIESGENLGFPRGTNLGIRRSCGKYLFLINPDVRVLPGCIEKMLRYLSENPRVGLLGPRMLGPDGRTGRSYMGAPTLWNQFCRAVALDTLFPNVEVFGRYLMLYFTPGEIVEVDVLNGWFWATRREAVDDVGLLDERLFMYGDDVDWSKRFHDGGWKVVYYPDAEAIHYGGATTARAPVRFSVEMRRANLQYWQKNHGRLSQVTFRSIVLLHEFLRLAGYATLSALRTRGREEVMAKYKRSVACFQWALGSKKHSARNTQAVIQSEARLLERQS